MTTAQDLIRDALQIVGAKQSGESLRAEEAQDHLRALNRMLDSWNIERLMVYTINPNVYDLVPGRQEYTFGPTGNTHNVRPVRIESAFIRVLSGTLPYDRPLKIVQDEGWGNIGVKTVSSPIPTILYNQNNYPDTSIFLWPIPNQAHKLVLYEWNFVTSLADINEELVLPPGYEEAIVYNLAIRLAPGYGASLDAASISLAMTSMQRIKANNTTPRYLACDKALLGGQRRGFNYLTGEFGRN